VDTLTHALSGALLARATAPAVPRPDQLNLRLRMTTGFLSAAFPDSDFVLRLVDTLTYLNLHQGVTHSIILLPLWALLLAGLFSFSTQRRYPWQAFFGIVSLGIAIHILGDLFTSYGTMILAPLILWRVSLPIIFLLDPFFTTIIIMGLVAAVFWPKQRHIASAALIILGCYVGLQMTLHQQAVRVGEAYAKDHGLSGAKSYALAQPLLPSNWKIIVSHNNSYYEALVDLSGTQSFISPNLPAGALTTIATSYQPVSRAVWKHHLRFGEVPSQKTFVHEAWNNAAFSDFRRFARYPALDQIEINNIGVCVWFVDLRYTLPGLAPSFRYGLCRSRISDQWKLERKHGAFFID
jgi:inner membrane protein